MRKKFIFSIILLSVLCEVQAQDLKKEAFGIWTLQYMPSGKYHSPDASLFYYNDSTLTRRLISMGLSEKTPQDDIYKLKTKWHGDTLFFLPPSADWVPQAVFTNGRFYSTWKNEGFFTKISAGDLNKIDKLFLAPKGMYKYDPEENSRLIEKK